MLENEQAWRWIKALLLPLIILAWLAVVVLVAWLLGHVTRTLLILVLAGIVGYALTPLVNVLVRWLPRVLAIAASYVVGMLVVLGFITFIVVTAAGQVLGLVHHLPTYVREAQGLQPQILALLGPFGVTGAQLSQLRSAGLAQAQQIGTQAAAGAVGAVQSAAGTILDMILVLMLSVYLTANGPRIGAWLRERGQLQRAVRLQPFVVTVNQVVGGYVRGTLTMAALVGFLVGTGMAILQLPYAILLGVIAFFMEFIPVVGVMISGAVCVGVALTQGWVKALIVLAYFIGVHVLEGDVIGPRVMGRAVGIHPAVALLAFAAGTELFGIWGALFGAPIAGLVQGLVTETWREVQRSRFTGGNHEQPGTIITP
jgi:predicted PurR-regulated permease PerM